MRVAQVRVAQVRGAREPSAQKRSAPERAALEWAAAVVGRAVESIAPFHPSSRTYGLELAGGGRVVLKLHRGRRKFDQEVRANGRFARPLGASPRLVAHAGDGRFWLLFQDAGHTAPAGSERDRAAGALLARLHGLDIADDDPISLIKALGLRARAAAAGAAGLVEEPTLEAVVECAASPWPAGLAPPHRVACHRDFAPYNWLTPRSRDGARGADPSELALIDWEHARPDSAATDLDRALGDPGVDADAFLDGYGRVDEGRAEELRRWAPVAALARIRWARDHGDLDLEHAGRQRLSSAVRPRT
ncbi:MAG: phosphotransferase [Planctomycetota bacterium]